MIESENKSIIYLRICKIKCIVRTAILSDVVAVWCCTRFGISSFITPCLEFRTHLNFALERNPFFCLFVIY